MVMPLTLATLPLALAVTMVSCLGPGGKLLLRLGTRMVMVSGVLPEPGVQLTMPPLAGQVGNRAGAQIGQVDMPAGDPGAAARADEVGLDGDRRAVPLSVERINGPCSDSARRVVLLAVRFSTWSRSGRAGPVQPRDPRRPSPRSGQAAGRAGWSRPGQTSAGVVAISRLGLKLALGCAMVPGSSTVTRYMPGQGPCGMGQLKVSVEGSKAS